MALTSFQRGFLARLDTPFTGEALFDCLADVVFFIKDSQARYVLVNQTLVERCGVANKAHLLGRTTLELFPQPLGRHYHGQDLRVLSTGSPIRNQLELHLYPDGNAGWCVTEKLPLAGKQGGVVGLVGVSRDLVSPNLSAPDYPLVAQVVQRVQTHLAEPLRVADLAAAVGLSGYQLDRRMRQIFQLSAAQFIQRARLDEAMRRLVASDEPVAAIALDCGYADHSAFARQFKRTVGLSPAQFRRSKQKPD